MRNKRKRRFYLVTLGCPKNVVDSEGMTEILARGGFQPTSQPNRAEFLIVNTCGFLKAAQDEAVQTLRELAASKQHGQQLVAAGCLPERVGTNLFQQVPELDGLIGARSWTDMGQFLTELSTGHRHESLVHLPEAGVIPVESIALDRSCLGPGVSAYLKISDGCSASCAFCTIPSIKGPARSRPRQLIIEEAQSLVNNGVKEIILIAQDTTAYGRALAEGGESGLPGLIEDILRAAPELHWLRLMYAYPGHATDRLTELMAAQPQICNYLDVPLQHGHPETLRRMHRPHQVEKTLDWIQTLRTAVPNVALRTTFIVGYPGETEAEFQGLLDFMAEIEFDKVGVFPFSRETGTIAYGLPDQVPEEIKQDRFEQAMELQQSISLAKNETQVGCQLEVLVEGSDGDISLARSYRDAPEIDGYVLVEGEWPANEFLPVRVTQASIYDLMAVHYDKQ